MIRKALFSALLTAFAPHAIAQETRQLDAHEHGVGELDLAIDGQQLVMEFRAPGADILGFEYVPEGDEDLAAVDGALAILGDPDSLFKFPAAAGCDLVDSHAELVTEDDHDEHQSEPEAEHTEFHGTYGFYCQEPERLTQIDFAYFAAFSGAREVEVRLVSANGARLYEVERDQPLLTLD